MTRSQLVDQVIRLAERIDAYWDRELPRRHPNYPVVGPGEDSGPPPPEEGELAALLRSRPPEDVYFVTALAYLGRGDYPPARVADKVRSVAETFPDPDRVIDRLLGMGALAEQLADGRQALAAANIDPDRVHLPAAA